MIFEDAVLHFEMWCMLAAWWESVMGCDCCFRDTCVCGWDGGWVMVMGVLWWGEEFCVRMCEGWRGKEVEVGHVCLPQMSW